MPTRKVFDDGMSEGWFFKYVFPVVFTVMFVGVGLLFLGGIWWNYEMYQDCRASGKSAYVCSSIVSQPTVQFRNLNEDENF